MKLTKKTAGVALGLAVAAVVAVPGAASAETVSSSVAGDTLTLTSAAIAFPANTLTGATQNLTSTAGSAWTLKDSRGTGASWAATISATAPTSAAGSVETTARTIAVSKLKVTAGTVTAGTDADPTTNITSASNLVLSASNQNLVSSTGTNKGTYTFVPSFGLEVPANAFRSNWPGTVGEGSLNPYVSTITLSIS